MRAEAIVGLARRDRAVALPLVHDALSGDSASLPLFDAAELVAHPSLVEPLRDWIAPSADEFLDKAHAMRSSLASEGSRQASGPLRLMSAIGEKQT